MAVRVATISRPPSQLPAISHPQRWSCPGQQEKVVGCQAAASRRRQNERAHRPVAGGDLDTKSLTFYASGTKCHTRRINKGGLTVASPL